MNPNNVSEHKKEPKARSPHAFKWPSLKRLSFKCPYLKWPSSLKRPSLRVVMMWVIPVVIVISALVFAKYQIATSPKAKRKKAPQQARLVTIEPVLQTNHKTIISAMGTVVPAKQVNLSPEISGRVVFVSPLVIPGGAIHEGQTLIRIDSHDHEAVVKYHQSQVAKAELNLKLEQGNQRVAKQEYEMLDDIVEDQDMELVLRKPHLEESRAALEAAKAALAKAQLDVERCTVTSPFNAVIQDKHVDVGAQVTPSSSLLNIMGADEYWVEVLVPVNQLQWITIPTNDQQQGSRVKIYSKAAWGPDRYRDGVVVRLLGQLEEEGRMAQLLVSVKDPMSLQSDSSELPPILVNSYVRVEIEGTTLDEVFPVKRDYLHDGDNIWIANDENRMEIRPVDIVFRDKNMVYLSNGVSVGDRIVTTDISAPVNGMLLRFNEMIADSEPSDQNPYATNPE